MATKILFDLPAKAEKKIRCINGSMHIETRNSVILQANLKKENRNQLMLVALCFEFRQDIGGNFMRFPAQN